MTGGDLQNDAELSPHQQVRMSVLFRDALLLPEEEQEAFVSAGSRGDIAVSRATLAWLREPARAVPEGFLDAPAEDAPNTVDLPSPVGPYVPIRRLGEGGIGEVWLAEQSGPVFRRVAMKLIKPGMDSAGVIARFDHERRALALMDHPNIARVHDAGMTQQGRPFFVMECVDGESITAYCDRLRLSVRERLELMLPVCEAVQHAHTKGIIHRDLKPSNILVEVKDEKPVPKVIDFGIAKAVAREGGGERSTAFTEVGQIVGTPEYMSPEQAAGDPGAVDTRTDVYSLGVVLYELLTGLRPFDFRELAPGPGSWAEIARTIRDVDPPKPSLRLGGVGRSKPSAGGGAEKVRAAPHTGEAIAGARRSEPGTLARELRRELEWIPLKAMRKEPRHRYQSPMELAGDIRRFLKGEALEAGPDSRAYRAKKYASKHRVAITAAAAIGVALGAGVLGTGLALANASMYMSRAATSEARASAIAEFSRRIHAAVEEASQRGDSDAVLTNLLDDAITATNQTFAQHVAARPQLLSTVGRTLQWVGRHKLAKPFLVRAFEMSSSETESAATWRLAHDLALLDEEMGELKEAEPIARRAVAEQRRLLGDTHEDTLATTMLLGLVLSQQGERTQEGIDLLSETLEKGRVAWGPDSPKTAILESNVAGYYKKVDHLDLAESLYEHALGVLTAAYGPDHVETLAVAGNLAGLYSVGGDPAHARTILRDTLPRWRAVVGDDDLRTLRAMNNLAAACEKLDELDESEKWYTTALGVQRRLLTVSHPDTITTISNLSIVNFKRGTPESLKAGESLADEALRAAMSTYGERDPRTLQIMNNLAMIEDKIGDTRAGALFERIIEVGAALQGEAHVNTLIYMSNAADWFERHGQVERARALYERAAEVSEKQRGESDFAALWAASDLAVFRRSHGDIDVAIAMHELVVTRARQARLAPEILGNFLVAYGKTLTAAGRAQEAVVVLTEAEQLHTAALGPESPQLKSTREALEAAKKLAGPPH